MCYKPIFQPIDIGGVMLIKVKDKTTNKVYTNEMDNDCCITEIHFCTSYTQVVVQDVINKDGKTTYPNHDVILPPLKSEPYWVDLIAIQNSNIGEWII